MKLRMGASLWSALKVLILFTAAGHTLVVWLTLLWYAQQGWEPMLINGRWMIAAGMEPNDIILQGELWALPALAVLGFAAGLHELRRGKGGCRD